MARKHRGYITVDVNLEEYLEALSDDDVRQEYESRFGPPTSVGGGFDLIAEVHAELIGGRTSAALALLDSAMVAARVDDAARQRQYQQAGRAH